LLTGQSALAATAAVTATIGPTAPYYTDDVTATVVVTGSGPTPTGSITGASDGGTSQSVGLVNGTARLELSFFAPGAHSFVYSYSGDSNYGASASQTLSFTVADRSFAAVGSEYSFTNFYRIQNPNIGNLNFATVAVDSKSNLYFPNAVSNTISKFDPLGNVTPIPVTGLNRPDGIVLDSSDNIYVADSGNQRVVEITAGGTQSVLPITGLSDPVALAFDPAFQYLYVADQGNGNIVVYDIAAQTQTVIATGAAFLSGIAVDANLNIFYSQISNQGDNGHVYRLDHANYGAPANATTLFTGISHPQALLLDPLGDLYIDSEDEGLLVLDTRSHLSQISVVADESYVVNGEYVMCNIAMDKRGKIYRAYNRTVFVPGTAANAGPATYDGSGTYNFQIYYQIPYGQTITAVTPVSGSQVSNLDPPQPGPSPATYPIEYTVSLYSSVGYYDLDGNDSFGAGPWSSSVTVTTSDGAQHPIVAYGTGLSPSFSIAPGDIMPQALTVSGVGGIAEDGGGTIYVSDPVGNAVLKLPASATTPTTLPFSGLNKPTQLAFDGSGAVYVLDSGSSRILKIDTQGNQSVVFDLSNQTALTSLSAFTMDGGTNLFLAGNAAAGGSAIYYLDTFGDQLLIASTTNQPTALAVDFFGFVYSVDTEGVLNRFDPGGNGTQIATGLQQPVSVAVDASGTAYVAGAAGSGITIVSPNGTKTPYPADAPAAESLTNASAVAVVPDGSGSLVVGDNSGKQVFQILRGLPYTRPQQLLNFSFGDVPVGSSKTINAFLANTGNLTSQSFGVTSPSGDFALATDPAECVTTDNASAFNPAFAPAATCGLTVTFSPTYTGAQNSYFNVFQANNSAEAFGGSDFSGDGVAAPALSISPATATFPSTPQGTSSAGQVFTITNSGLGAANISSVAIGGADASAFTETTTCGATLAPNSNCSVTVVFTPNAAARTFNASLSVISNDPKSPAVATLTGSSPAATAPAIKLTPSSLNFPDTQVGGASAAQAVTVANTGTATTNLTSITLGGAGASSFSENSGCGTTLAVNASCTVNITFIPTAANQTFNATLSVVSNDPASPATATLTGKGLTAGLLSIAPATQVFPSTAVGATSAAQTSTITNSTPQSVDLSTGALTDSTDFTESDNCGGIVNAGATCTVTFTFKPQSTGALTSTYSIHNLNTPNTALTVALSGTGTAAPAPVAALTPATLTYSATTGTTSAAQTATLTNSGTAALSISSISLTGTNSAAFASTNTCGSSLAAGASCTISVTFDPASAGTDTATLSVSDNAPESPQTSTLTGVATAPPPAADFTISATPSAQSVTAGSAATYSVAAVSTGGSFTDPVTLTASGLPPGATVSFSPASVTPGSSLSSSSMTVQTIAEQASAREGPARWPLPTGLITVALLVLPFRRRGRVFIGLACWLLLLGASTALTGCGGGFALPQSPSATYTITVTGTSGSTQHSTTVQLTVR
jgi:sugar lactone lactonase YvrE